MRIDLLGRRSGRLLVVAVSERRAKDASIYWKCVCDCGNQTEVIASFINRGVIQSCGCLTREINARLATKHGERSNPLYCIWASAKSRCHQPKHSNYSNYGGRGIVMCERWRNSFAAFLEDMGPRPEGHTLERENNDGNYEPGNCVWATAKTQANNRRKPRRAA